MKRAWLLFLVLALVIGATTAAGLWAITTGRVPLVEWAGRLEGSIERWRDADASVTVKPEPPSERAQHVQHGTHPEPSDYPSASGGHEGHAEPAPTATAPEPEKERKVLYYRNPMGLPDTSPVPKKDPMGMDYIPVYEEEDSEAPGVVRVSPERVQTLGVRTEAVVRRKLVRPIRAVGTVRFDERRTFVVTTKFSGWIERLVVNATGDQVQKGEPLMDVYSPDLVLAQRDYLVARQRLPGDDRNERSDMMAPQLYLETAEQRLDYLDFPVDERRRLESEGKVRGLITLVSPYTGTVIEKQAIEGMRFEAGDPLYQIVDLSTVWLIAEVFEQDLAQVAAGQEATIRLEAYPGHTFEGRVAFIYPTVNTTTRTVAVRIEIPNSKELLKADMYAEVEIAAPLDEQEVLAVPDSAVIDSGARQIVLVEKGEGRFEPRSVRVGTRVDGYIEVMEGLTPDERVVVSANFLIDAESNLKAALGGFGHQGHAAQ